MQMEITDLSGLRILKPKLFTDVRGAFSETFNQRNFSQNIGEDITFVQDNESISHQGVLRGLHYQIQQPQGKLIHVVSGSIWDVAVDLRRSSPTFGQWAACELSAENHVQFWIPVGFAHGFIALSPSTQVLYKVTDYYAPAYERCILWSDPTLGITWPEEYPPLVSSKDAQGSLFSDADYFP